MTIMLRRFAFITLLMASVWSAPGNGTGLSAAIAEARAQTPVIRQFTVKARRYVFEPSRIEVNRGDIVKITLIAEDVPHTFTLDEYRICRRFSPGRDAKVEFYADQPGTFTFYCNLTGDEGCRDMKGTLVVR
jgi:cytochrome c oxidase subunit 2